jgi:hypothetical protein
MVTFLSPIFHISVNSHIYIIIDKLFSVLLLRQELYMIGHRTKKSAYIYIYMYIRHICSFIMYIRRICPFIMHMYICQSSYILHSETFSYVN